MPAAPSGPNRVMRRGRQPRRPGGKGDCLPGATARAWCFPRGAQAIRGGPGAHEEYAADPLARIQELLAVAFVAVTSNGSLRYERLEDSVSRLKALLQLEFERFAEPQLSH